MLSDVLAAVLMSCGLIFFTAGTIGLIRFPDVRSQLHALTKADNLGLGLLLLGVAVYVGDLATGVGLLLVWLLALGASSISAQALAGAEAETREGDAHGRTL
ncbi:monovalent cation/H(+) antiporter subunit G [Corynebacterium sp. YIM 101645]|uniref:Monovalent cation/H(+) antiporter subunit G n=1 Tax=Corynebacterium lemuris TaxID=1859292 RepID=A0ABT2G0I2_9CORY|nr:monovalent cation/H(+) antiporter subunit G [Corynebacterium lemuris]MCS5480991.1 monovalent cation/H(+) antiporter subunit G [Corynebacterium lemuris]